MAARRRVTKTVHVYGDDGAVTVLEAGDTVPTWARDQVSNPKAFEDDDDGEPVSVDSPTPDGEAAAPTRRRQS